MSKNVGLTYVKEFEFPKEQGFTGSASSGVHQVRGYMRGGPVKKSPGYGEGGYYGKPGDKYPNKGAKQKMPKNVKAHGGSVHDRLKSEGAKMGYAYGGRVHPSNTSAEFKQTSGKQATMDHGNQPARRGRNQAEIEAGGTKRLKPGLMKGGGVHKVRYSKKGMPKNVKAKGGLMQYAEGGYAAGDKMSHPKGRGRTPYKGYNAQAGGSGNADARYMGAKRGK